MNDAIKAFIYMLIATWAITFVSVVIGIGAAKFGMWLFS